MTAEVLRYELESRQRACVRVVRLQEKSTYKWKPNWSYLPPALMFLAFALRDGYDSTARLTLKLLLPVVLVVWVFALTARWTLPLCESLAARLGKLALTVDHGLNVSWRAGRILVWQRQWEPPGLFVDRDGDTLILQARSGLVRVTLGSAEEAESVIAEARADGIQAIACHSRVI